MSVSDDDFRALKELMDRLACCEHCQYWRREYDDTGERAMGYGKCLRFPPEITAAAIAECGEFIAYDE